MDESSQDRVPEVGQIVHGYRWDGSRWVLVEGQPDRASPAQPDGPEWVVPEVSPARSGRWSGDVGLLVRGVTAAVLVQAGVVTMFMPSVDLMEALVWTPVDWGWLVPGAALNVIVNTLSILVLRTGGLLGNLVVGAGLVGIGVWVWRGSRAAAVIGMILIAIDSAIFGTWFAGYPLVGWGLAVLARLSMLLLLGVAFRVARSSGGGSRPAWLAAWLGILGTAGHLVASVGLVLTAVSPPATPPPLDFFPQPASSCAVTATGGVKCWGLNNAGQLGDGTTPDRSSPVAVAGLASGVAAVSVGGYHACAVTTSGGVQCWGWNEDGQLGDGTTTQRSSPVAVAGLASGVTTVSAGRSHTCALTTRGGVLCWGSNDDGQLGDGTTTDRSSPVEVAGLTSGVTAVSAGLAHTCAVTTTSGVTCWGSNDDGQLGDGTTTDSSGPMEVAGLASGVTAVSAGYWHTCAVTSTGGVKCWGSNVWGELGDEALTDHSTPVEVAGLTSKVMAVSAGYYYTCAITKKGGVWCWGRNEQDQLGSGAGTDPFSSTTPVAVVGLTSGVATVATGNAHTCAVTTAGGVKCWGMNDRGQLGDGTTTDSSTPVQVVGF